jgi:predicted tellurium resistance membrane protein TerC
MTEWAFQIMRLMDRHPLLYSGVALAMLVVALELIGWHLEPDMFCMFR